MKIVDANIILRFLINDNEKQFLKAKDILLHNDILILTEVLAEVVYVLQKVYRVNRNEIKAGLLDFFANDNISLDKASISKKALNYYSGLNLDFVDCILYAHATEDNSNIETFDKKLKKLIKKNVN